MGIDKSREALRDLISPAAASRFVYTALTNASGVVANGLLVLLIVAFMLAEAHAIPQRLRAAFPGTDGLEERLQKLLKAINRYMMIKLIMSLATAICIWVWLWMIGVDYAATLAVVAFLFNFIPVVGNILMTVPAVLVALVQGDISTALMVVLGYTIVNIAIGNILEPRLTGRELGISPRTVEVPVLDDTAVEGEGTLALQLTGASGCADIGVRSSATLTIGDDDAAPAASYTIGGTVTGLAGSGLVLRVLGLDLPIASSGAFAFPRTYATGVIYEVTVAAQPDAPRQSCTVANGSGTIAGANVTNVAVTCTTLSEPGGLDPSFGTGGRVYTAGVSAGATDLALQPDGKLLVVGGNQLLRYLPNGALDPAFGTNGAVTVTFYGRSFDSLEAVALQPDGRIIVVGNHRDHVAVRLLDRCPSLRRHSAPGTHSADFLPGPASLSGVQIFPGSAAGAAAVVAGSAAADGRAASTWASSTIGGCRIPSRSAPACPS